MKRLTGMFLCLCLCCSLFTGCDFFSASQNVEELLTPPKLTQEQAAVVNALEEVEGGSIQLKYPDVGTGSSPLLLADLDADGKQEAVVFYVAPQKGKNARIALLKETSKGYEVAFEAEGTSPEVEGAAVASFYSGRGLQLVVGYQNPSLSENYMMIYNCTDGSGGLALEKMGEQSYARFLVCDMTGDGLDDLVFASSPAELDGRMRLTLLSGQSGQLQQLSTLTLGEKITGCQSLLISTGSPHNTLVADCDLGVASTCSIAVYYASGKLREYQMLGGSDFIQRTTRSNALLQSMDLDEDGAVELPSLSGPFPGAANANRFLQVEWYDPFYSVVQPKLYGLVDMEYGYFLRLPEALRGSCMVSYKEKERGWSLIDPATGRLLFDVVMLGKGEKLTGADERDYEQVAASAGYRIFIRIGQLPDGLDKGTLLAGFINLK